MGLWDFYAGTSEDDAALSWHYFQKSGEGLWRSIADLQDAAVDAARQAVLARLPWRAPDDALPEIGRTFNLDWPARLTPQEQRDYIGDPWVHWENAGTRARMLSEVAALGYSNSLVVTYRDLVDIEGKPPTVFGGFSSFWYLLIKPPHVFGPGGKWDDMTGLWDDAPYQWDLRAPSGRIAELERVIAKWKPASSSCRYIEIWLTVNLFGLPTNLVRIPIHEAWEVGPDGAARNFYNEGYE